MNILAIAAHPDDIELQCAGTLARYANEGHNVSMAIFTSGDMGDLVIKPEELARVRKSEAEASAALIGAKLIWPGITDEHVFPNETQRQLMIDVMRTADPDVIITHHPSDYHPDHRYVGQLVFDSYYQKGLPHIPKQKVEACRFAHAQIYYMDNLGGVEFLPTEYVDICATMETKLEMLRCHKSQYNAFDSMVGLSLEDMMKVQAQFRGLAAGCLFAEGFRRHDAFQRGLVRRVLPE